MLARKKESLPVQFSSTAVLQLDRVTLEVDNTSYCGPVITQSLLPDDMEMSR